MNSNTLTPVSVILYDWIITDALLYVENLLYCSWLK